MAAVVPSGATPAVVYDLTLPHTRPDCALELAAVHCIVGGGHAHRCTGGCRHLRKETQKGDGQALTALKKSAASQPFQGGRWCSPDLT
jgi:hypothetical protein